jgi:hypothetical protein
MGGPTVVLTNVKNKYLRNYAQVSTFFITFITNKQQSIMATTSGRTRAIEILESLRNDWDYSDKSILDYVINNWMSGQDAEQVMVDFCEDQDIKIPGEES